MASWANGRSGHSASAASLCSAFWSALKKTSQPDRQMEVGSPNDRNQLGTQESGSSWASVRCRTWVTSSMVSGVRKATNRSSAVRAAASQLGPFLVQIWYIRAIKWSKSNSQKCPLNWILCKHMQTPKAHQLAASVAQSTRRKTSAIVCVPRKLGANLAKRPTLPKTALEIVASQCHLPWVACDKCWCKNRYESPLGNSPNSTNCKKRLRILQVQTTTLTKASSCDTQCASRELSCSN